MASISSSRSSLGLPLPLASVAGGGSRDAAIVGLALRFALNAPPFGLRRASLRARPTINQGKRDSSNGVRKGTFLKSFSCRFATPTKHENALEIGL